jgi:hypothetical protein
VILSLVKWWFIFGEKYFDMILKWYNEIDHQATTQAIMEKYPSEFAKHEVLILEKHLVKSGEVSSKFTM